MSVIIDQLRISDDGKNLFIDVHVNKSSYFENVYLRRITICTEDQVSELNPQAYSNDFIYQEEIPHVVDGEVVEMKELHRVLCSNVFNEKFKKCDLSHNMFFVYIDCAGTPSSDTPCRLDEMTTLGVTLDYGVIYNIAMNNTRELADTCKVPQRFHDFILNFEAMKISIETEHYIPAIHYWKNILGQPHGAYMHKGCGCHQ